MNAKSDSDSDDDSVLGFGAVDFSGVDFDAESEEEAVVLRPSDFAALELEQIVLALGKNIPKDCFSKYTGTDDSGQDDVSNIVELGQQLAAGKYLDILKGASAQKFLGDLDVENADSKTTVPLEIRKRIFSMAKNVQDCMELECIGIAALNLFLQLNYTGPSLEECIGDIGTAPKEDPLLGIHPHPCFTEHLSASAEDSTVTSKTQLEEKEEGETKQTETSITTSSFVHTKFHNAVLAELAVDGEWPCQVCQVPYFLLLARSIFISLANPKSMDWMHSSDGVDETDSPTSSDAPKLMVALSKKLTGAHIWSARAAVAHGRLIQSIEPPITLWEEVKSTFERCVEKVCPDDLLADITNNNPDSDTLKVDDSSDSVWERRKNAATLMLEWGLAQHHFDQPGMGRKCFDKALEYSGLKTTLTGAQGVRTKFQTKQTAQMLVEAVSTAKDARSDSNNSDKENDSEEIEKGGKNLVKQQEVEVDDELLLGRVKFEDESKNKVQDLNVLDQAILLSLCLDVKNTNPSGDELTNEEMSAYLARVLDHHDDWMLYSTALLERSWLEFERTHGKERAILQVQALADQHTNRLTLTQSTKKSVEESAPVQDRLCNLHTIVYPPRWEMLKDLGNRYANCGILMSAAELFTQIELWDEVVECYRRAGRAGKAEEIVRERLGIQETPRMWAALGDLTQDPTYWEKAVDLSKGRFSTALVALGAYYFEKGDVIKSAEYYEKSLEIRMIAPAVWFRLGTINMQLDKWDNALRAFSRVVQLEPEEHEAWANVAAIHMRNKNPTEAYPALNESLRQHRSNWRVWTSKLYVCLDLKKYDEAVQACNSILDLKNQMQAQDKIPPLEERCVRALVGGSIERFQSSRDDAVALDSAKRSLTRVHALLERLQSINNPEPWLFETIAFFHEQIGGAGGQQVIDNLMKEYRALQTVPMWEKDDNEINKICQVVSQIAELQRREGSKEALSKSKFLIRGVVSKVKKSRIDATNVPAGIVQLETLMANLETDIKK